MRDAFGSGSDLSFSLFLSRDLNFHEYNARLYCCSFNLCEFFGDVLKLMLFITQRSIISFVRCWDSFQSALTRFREAHGDPELKKRGEKFDNEITGFIVLP